MGRNQIKIVDESISLLVKLEDFSLNENLIEVLPATIGNLNALSKLGLKGNRLLRELPLSLGGVPGLTHVDTTDTAIPDECRDAILNMCQALRKQENGFVRLKLWMDVAGVAPDQYSGIQLESPEIIDLNEWLCRLEKTKDFCDNQQALTQIVCQMLLDLQDLEFKADFFLVVRENLTRCEDRAAMSLNLAYAVWKAHAVKDEKSAKKKCEVLVGLAKTNTLRKRLAQLIGEHDRKTVAEAKEKGTYKPAIDYSWKESVQGYLYYETHLQQVLGLVTAIQNMKYKSIGAVTWINKDELIAYVKDHYIEELMELPLFEQLEKEDKAYKESYDREVGELMNRVFLLDNQKNEEERAADGVDAKQEYRQLRIRLVGEFIKELLSRP